MLLRKREDNVVRLERTTSESRNSCPKKYESNRSEIRKLRMEAGKKPKGRLYCLYTPKLYS